MNQGLQFSIFDYGTSSDPIYQTARGYQEASNTKCIDSHPYAFLKFDDMARRHCDQYRIYTFPHESGFSYI